MSWRHIPSDNWSLERLLHIRRFLEDDLRRAREEVVRMERYRNYNLPNWRSQLIHAQQEVEESFHNLEICDLYIIDAREKGL